jgi:hypothetical protein
MPFPQIPRYTHTCPDCTFLGQHKDYDLYYCPQGGMDTVIARFGGDGSAYASGLNFADAVPELAEAKRLATELGLLPAPKPAPNDLDRIDNLLLTKARILDQISEQPIDWARVRQLAEIERANRTLDEQRAMQYQHRPLFLDETSEG